MLTEIASFCDLNLGGLALVEYAPLPWINTAEYPDYVNAAGNIDQDITFASGDWLRCPFLLPSMSWSEPFVESPHNGHYEPQLGGTTPHLRPEVSLQLGRMKNYSFILRIKDRNGRKWIIGHPFFPLRLTYTLASATPDGLAAYTLSWKGQQKTASPGFLLPV
jgi:hypothetical protein